MSEFSIIECCNCGIRFGVSHERNSRLRESHKTFYCPSGHPQSYSGESEKERLRRENERMVRRMAWKDDELLAAERSVSAMRGQITKIKKRAAAGVCPCCNRQFQNLHRHMLTKHPSFVEETGGETQTIRAKRVSKGYTQAKLADLLGIPVHQISRIENQKSVPEDVETKLNDWKAKI